MTGDLEQGMLRAMNTTIIKALEQGGWLNIPYRAVEVPASVLKGIYEQLDWNRVKALVKDGVEEHVAKAILMSMTTELNTDVKQIMCNKELREEIRSIMRTHMKAAMGGLTKEDVK